MGPHSLTGPMSQPSQKDVQGRRWCFVFYEESDLEKLRLNPLEALVVALEEGTENKRQHYQGYVKFSSNRRWSWWSRTFHCHPEESGLNSAHWDLAKGPEWKCRRYIVDVAAYLASPDCDHQKTQGEVLFDYGCEVRVPDSDSPGLRCLQMLTAGACMHQLFKEHPWFFFQNSRKLADMHGYLIAWRESGVDYEPQASAWEAARKRYKRAPPSDGVRSDE